MIVVSPVYDDAEAASRVVRELHEAAAREKLQLRVVLVDDGSPIPLTEQLQITAGCPVEVIRLKRNVGHQRAIALGISYVQENEQCDVLLVMDADGEDQPKDAIRLIQQCVQAGGTRVIFADRTRRSESFAFQILYRCYQLLHWVLTGIRVRVGNFSAIPAKFLPAIVTLPALWNHYAAALFHARLPREAIPTERGKRYSGVSKMNVVSLVVHGLQAISVFIEVVSVRLLFLAWGLALLCVGIFLIALFTPWLPASALYLSAAVAVLSIALGISASSLSLNLLSQRNRLDFIPIRDYRIFVEEHRVLGAEVSKS